ncbi:MAG: HD superfamily phosphohydrolase [Parvicellaceae bacterium]
MLQANVVLETLVNKKKIFNDPIYGFITIPYELILDLIDHPYFQRLRRIKQLGLTDFVYPGALHTRFHHAVGCTYLMQKAILNLRQKGNEITEEEAIGVTVAILLHDIGHGPFSHALEHSLVDGITHEEISLLIMQQLNIEFDGQLDIAISIFKNSYPKKFLHQLVSSQLDMDRLDYLKRDSFYSGVSEGVVSSERIIQMLDVVNDELVVEQKGIYSVENFIVARRLMYWQVYLHKTVISAEFMLVKILERAKLIASSGTKLFGSPALIHFLTHKITQTDFNGTETLEAFTKLDDYDLMGAIKVWIDSDDKILAILCKAIIHRNLFKVTMNPEATGSQELENITTGVMDYYQVSRTDAEYLIINEEIANNAYNPKLDSINLVFKNGDIKDITEASDNLNIQALTRPVKKYFVCHPKLRD